MKWIHKVKVKKEWEKWFAWHTVPIGTFPIKNGSTLMWLEFVERKWLDCREGKNRYEYRMVQP